MSGILGAPGSTKVIRFEVRDPVTKELVNPAGGVVIEWAHLDDPAMTLVDSGSVDNSIEGVFVFGVPCPTAGGYGARITTAGDYTGVFEHFWQIDDSDLPAIV